MRVSSRGTMSVVDVLQIQGAHQRGLIPEPARAGHGQIRVTDLMVERVRIGSSTRTPGVKPTSGKADSPGIKPGWHPCALVRRATG
jgi:hypothetical protein